MEGEKYVWYEVLTKRWFSQYIVCSMLACSVESRMCNITTVAWGEKRIQNSSSAWSLVIKEI